jgi:[lysine-biosynthesis-protein LysW]---L-2-aminoadipate ligase
MYPIYQVYYLEEFVNRPPRDIRAIVVGDKVVAAIYRYSGEDQWKTNMALGGRAEELKVTKELEDICIKAKEAVQGQIVGVDLMESKENGLVVHEVNNTTEYKNTVRVTGVNIPAMMIDYAMSQGK